MPNPALINYGATRNAQGCVKDMKWNNTSMYKRLIIRTAIFLIVFSSGTLQARGVMSPNAESVQKLDAPDWVSSIELAPLIASPPRDFRGTSYLLSDSQVRVSTGGIHNYRRYASLLTDSNGLTANSQLQFDFDPSYQTLTIHQIHILRNGEVIDKLQDAGVKYIQKEEELDSLIYNGVVTALVVLDDVRVGDVIDYSFSVQGVNPVYGDKYFGGFPLEWKPSVGHLRVRILMPKLRPVRYMAYQSDIEPRISVHATQREYLWEKNTVAGRKIEEEYPAWYTAYAWLQVTEYEDWQEVAAWALNLYATNDSAGENKDISQFLESAKEEASSKKELLSHLINFVQDDIRYFGVEFGDNSHKPSSPPDVFSNRYGDCKDKSLLLHYLFSKIGINSSPVLVSSSNTKAINEWLPSPGVFDHVILRFTFKGREYWVDPTRSMQEGSLENLYISPFSYGLPIYESTTRLVDIPPNTIPNRIEVSEVHTFPDYESPADLSVQTKYSGALSEYKRLEMKGFEESVIEKDFIKYYQSLYL